MVVARFGNPDAFKVKVNPDTQVYFGKNQTLAIMGEYPTLNDIEAAYGEGFAVEWLIPHLASLALYAGAQNLTKPQLHELARVIATEYRHLKITEILLFLFKFKTGAYGRFYGNVDPLIITQSLREFSKDRAEVIDAAEQEKAQQKRDEWQKDTISYEEWQRIKAQETQNT